jgi:acyl-CoA synthetase (AMP-forming)/AMP-acid ligase II
MSLSRLEQKGIFLKDIIRRILMEMNYNPTYNLYKNSHANPDKIALSVDNKTYTYIELASFARKIATWIDTFSFKRIIRVGVLAGRSIDAITGILGTCWAGCIYVPLNPAWPKKRIASVIEQSELNALIIDKNCINLLDDDISEIFPSHILSPMIHGKIDTKKSFVGIEFLNMLMTPSRYPVFILPEDIVSMTFMSGSTETLKTERVTAEKMASLLQSKQEHDQMTSRDILSQDAEMTFGQLIFEILSVG